MPHSGLQPRPAVDVYKRQLLSVVNLKLRDFYKNLDALCEDLDADKADDLCLHVRCQLAHGQRFQLSLIHI